MLGRGFKAYTTSGAELDIAEAFKYYSDISFELGERFLQTADSRISALESFWAFELLDYNLRKVRINPFPYHIWYRLEEDTKIIRIVAVKHERIESSFS
jgi:mRNA-degrading endonuclease RelE of RelBE toxin-antitoxin system